MGYLERGCSQSGCSDPYADNYNANAFFDDGSCIYFQEVVVLKEDYADPNSEEAQIVY